MAVTLRSAIGSEAHPFDRACLAVIHEGVVISISIAGNEVAGGRHERHVEAVGADRGASTNCHFLRAIVNDAHRLDSFVWRHRRCRRRRR